MADRSPSTIKRPPEKLISRAYAAQAGADSVETYLAKGWSLGIACKNCPRLVEWTPPDLLQRFGDRLDLRIALLVPKLACSGPQGCGSREVAVFPHPYDGEWSYAPKD